MASFIGGIILWWVGNGAGHDFVDGNCVGFIDCSCNNESGGGADDAVFLVRCTIDD